MFVRIPTKSEISFNRIIHVLCIVLLLFHTFIYAQNFNSSDIYIEGDVYIYNLNVKEVDTIDLVEVSVYVSEDVLLVNFDELKSVNLVLVGEDTEKHELNLKGKIKKDLVEEKVSKAEEITIARKELDFYLNFNPEPYSYAFILDVFQDFSIYPTTNKIGYYKKINYINLLNFRWISNDEFRNSSNFTSKFYLLYKVRPPPHYNWI